MKKIYLLIALLLSCVITKAQLPKLVFGNTNNVSVFNYSPVVSVVQYGSGNTSTNFDLNMDGTPDISLNIERKLSSLYESAYINYPNAAAEVALSTVDDVTVIAFKSGDSLFAENYSFDFDEGAFDGALLYVSSGTNSYGQFSVAAFRYMAFRILSTDTLYGWLRLAKTADFNSDSLAYHVDQLAYEGALTDILPINQFNDLTVYPTITSDAVFIDNKRTVNSQASLYNLAGKLLYREDLKLSQNVIHLSSYPSGMYLLVLSSDEGDKTIKLVKQ